MRELTYPLLLLFTLLLVVVLIKADHSEMAKTQVDSLAIYRQEARDLDAELTKALALQQCYHEELIRLVFECYPESVYTIPCNGRKVVVR